MLEPPRTSIVFALLYVVGDRLRSRQSIAQPIRCEPRSLSPLITRVPSSLHGRPASCHDLIGCAAGA
jgi:hypothetical protein